MTNWEKSSIWKKRLTGFFSYQGAAWMALFAPVQVDLAMRDVLNAQFSDIKETT